MCWIFEKNIIFVDKSIYNRKMKIKITNDRQARIAAKLIVIAVILGVPALIFGLFVLIFWIFSPEDLISGSLLFTILSLVLIFKIWKDSPLNFYGERKKKIMRENLETWNRLHRRECRKIDKETEREIMRDDYHGPTSNPNAAGYLGSNPFGGFGC